MTISAQVELLKQENAKLRRLLRSTRNFVPPELREAIDKELKIDTEDAYR